MRGTPKRRNATEIRTISLGKDHPNAIGEPCSIRTLGHGFEGLARALLLPPCPCPCPMRTAARERPGGIWRIVSMFVIRIRCDGHGHGQGHVKKEPLTTAPGSEAPRSRAPP